MKPRRRYRPNVQHLESVSLMSGLAGLLASGLAGLESILGHHHVGRMPDTTEATIRGKVVGEGTDHYLPSDNAYVLLFDNAKGALTIGGHSFHANAQGSFIQYLQSGKATGDMLISGDGGALNLVFDGSWFSSSYHYTIVNGTGSFEHVQGTGNFAMIEPRFPSVTLRFG
jgi:hypothetical protein